MFRKLITGLIQGPPTLHGITLAKMVSHRVQVSPPSLPKGLSLSKATVTTATRVVVIRACKACYSDRSSCEKVESPICLPPQLRLCLLSATPHKFCQELRLPSAVTNLAHHLCNDTFLHIRPFERVESSM